ncbi:hypothetical protein [Calycomorphotria hydatis]|uniref:Uncharacterized protein n=1 Tax=Calycomorphotria hydatis TaxID=2528027 RepID=A0A517TAG0_9PLAN|nr:hypothetical protein [Calycomorphotria hydatis]QDT65355.1 hypothetical protein V22_26080 [Calycomorphotria hydatis]
MENGRSASLGGGEQLVMRCPAAATPMNLVDQKPLSTEPQTLRQTNLMLDLQAGMMKWRDCTGLEDVNSFNYSTSDPCNQHALMIRVSKKLAPIAQDLCTHFVRLWPWGMGYCMGMSLRLRRLVYVCDTRNLVGEGAQKPVENKSRDRLEWNNF